MLLRSRARAGFTLLEILLASLIAALLLAALYFAMNMTLQQAQTARDAVESDDLTRGVFAKMTGDLNGTLAPLPPKSGGNAAASGGTVTGGTPGTDPNAAAAPADPAAGATGTAPAPDPNAATAEPATPGATDNSTAVAADLAFQGGLIGDNTKFTLFVGRTPEVFGRYGNPGEQVRADLRQVIYWFEDGRGLYRRERPWVTAEGVRNGVETDPDAPDSVLLAEEVTAVTFEYAEGTGFVGTWDGTTPGPDGVTPMGPPRAVKITLTYQVPVGRGKTVDRTVSQVIVIRAAPGSYTPPLLEAPTDGATEGGGTTGGGTTGGATTGGSTTGGATGGGMTGGAPMGGGMAGGGNTGGTRPTGGGATGGGATGGGSTGTRPSGGGATGEGGSTGGGRTSGGGTTGGGTTGGGGR